jgi:iron complex transport system substrate-binding protein
MIRKTFLWTLLFALLLAACAPAPVTTPQSVPVLTQAVLPQTVTPALTSTPQAVSYTDGLGRQIKLDHIPQRIVSLTPATTEILFAVGAGSQVVGRDEFSDYPALAKSLSSVGGSMGQYSTEQIVKLQPDLVIAGEINTPELVKSLQDLGLTVYYLKNPTTLDEMYTKVQLVGQMTGHPTTDLTASLKSRVAAVDAKVATVTTKPTVFYEIDASDANKPYTAGPGTFIDLLIQRAGAVNVGSSLKDQYPQVSLEQVVSLNPSMIVLGDSLYGVTPTAVKARAGWQSIDAVKTGAIFTFDDNLASRPGPRLVDGLEQLAKIFHPDLFK